MIMRNSVILVDQVQTEMAEGRDPWNAVLEAAVHRTRPVALTAAATVLAMVPLTRSIFWGPMAIAIMGGLTVATILTIFFVPALYAAWFRVARGGPGQDRVPASRRSLPEHGGISQGQSFARSSLHDRNDIEKKRCCLLLRFGRCPRSCRRVLPLELADRDRKGGRHTDHGRPSAPRHFLGFVAVR